MGVPPLTGDAVKVTFVPAHIGLALSNMLTEALSEETVIVIIFEFAGLPVAHGSLEVRTQRI